MVGKKGFFKEKNKTIFREYFHPHQLMDSPFRLGLLMPIFLFFLISMGSAQDYPTYQRIYLSGEDTSHPIYWDFKFSSGENQGVWSKIPVPFDRNMQDYEELNYGIVHQDSSSLIGNGNGEFRSEFFAKKEWKGNTVNLVFDGSISTTEVWVNGKSAGPVHEGGYQRFQFDISKLLDFGDSNLLEVKVHLVSSKSTSNEDIKELEFLNFGGIVRPVYLEVLPNYHFTELALNPNHKGNLSGLVLLNKAPKTSKLEVELIDPNAGHSVGKFQQTIDSDSVSFSHLFQNIKAWNPESPTLYKVYFRLIDKEEILIEKKETVGFRSVSLVGNDGLYVNGEKVLLKGVDRNSFYPTLESAFSGVNHLEELLRMKEMNLNAVQLSDFPPDEKLLEFADSLGLFILEKTNGWQEVEDENVDLSVLNETIKRDGNHPSVILWDHGYINAKHLENESTFPPFDIQNRPSINSWSIENSLRTNLFSPFNNSLKNSHPNAEDVFLQTDLVATINETGAGLSDIWSKFTEMPLFAGGLISFFSNEVVINYDLFDGIDSYKENSSGGIANPFWKKNGLFHSIQSMWSPIQIYFLDQEPQFSGRVGIANQYLFSDLSECQIQIEVLEINGWEKQSIIGSTINSLPPLLPGQSTEVDLELPSQWQDGDVLKFRAFGIHGEELASWTRPLHEPKEGNHRYFDSNEIEVYPIKVRESIADLQVEVEGKLFFFGKKSGNLELVKIGRKFFYLSQNPVLEGIDIEPEKISWKKKKDGSIEVSSSYQDERGYLTWTVLPNGQLKLEVAISQLNWKGKELPGVGFNLPDSLIQKVDLISDGPSSVWSYRREVVEFGLWEKINQKIQEEGNLEENQFPEFKGEYANFHAVKLTTQEGEIEIKTETSGIVFSLFKPLLPTLFTSGLQKDQLRSDLSFHYDNFAFRTKNSLIMEPEATNVNESDLDLKPLILWFNFR